MERVTIRIPEQQADEVDQLVEAGIYPSKSEVFRAALRDLIREEQQSVSQ